MFDYSKPSNAPDAFVFGGCSFGTLVGVDRLHAISFWRKSCLQYELLLDLLFNYIPHLWLFHGLVFYWVVQICEGECSDLPNNVS
jgi:hypothetical protein